MIDKNDVKMPAQTENIDFNNRDLVRKIEDLLDMLNEVENKQELRLKSDYYAKFSWFGGEKEKSYFSYQEEAVYDFIFNLNKSGILSDQVGMGKTIEAGMIISELASRHELRSLLIVVPNEIMAQKWEYELENKFGIKSFVRRVGKTTEIYPKVTAIKNYDDYCRCVFDCLAEEKFVELYNYKFEHKYEATPGVEDTLDKVIKGYVEADIQQAVKLVNQGIRANRSLRGKNINIVFDGQTFAVEGTDYKRSYSYDAGGEVSKYLKGKQMNRVESTINFVYFQTSYNKIIQSELNNLYTLIGDYFTTLPDEITSIAKNMSSKYPFLVIPISYSEHNGEQIITHPFLNRKLLPKVENYKHRYMVQNSEKKITEVYEEYRIIDFFIDVGYQTLIVDEVHDYIDVFAKVERKKFHTAVGYDDYPSDQYNRYELFDDYYFIKKSSLYKKLKSLADKANRKIFLTATPIKSDMVDFYLLTLLASNIDSDSYKKISQSLHSAFPQKKDLEETVYELYAAFKACVEFVSAKHFCDFSNVFFAAEGDYEESGTVSGRYRYPYFNNSFLRENVKNVDLITEYLLGQISYMSMEEIIMELIQAYGAENANNIQAGVNMRVLLEDLRNLLSNPDGDNLQTRVVFRTLFNNNIKIRFEEDFAGGADGKGIKRIRELLQLDDGARKWNKTYRKYGIRHTRHQTYNLAECDALENLSKNRIERYKNLPIWPKRDGKVLFLVRDDVFFDCFLDVKRDRQVIASEPVKMEDLPNYDRLIGSEAEKKERFANANAIFDYIIHDSMSGGLPDTHEPSSSRYESVDLDDSGMIDYKLALVNRLMYGRDRKLGAVTKKVLLFAENGREEITEWFKYQKCAPIYNGETLDSKKLEEYNKKWRSYQVEPLGDSWKVSEDAEDLSRYDGNLLIIIDPKRYEKGVDLQKANTIINFDINYCPLKMEQRIGRIDRIRPNTTKEDAKINIVSFVPMNDMSGYVINFFANELKMFTQWMGETTGIVSVPEEDAGTSGEDVSFEGKVYKLEEYYRYIYDLCNKNINEQKISEMAKAFSMRFDSNNDNYNEDKTALEFRYLNKLRVPFDKAFRNSVSPHREGYELPGGGKVIRFNSALGPFVECGADNCRNCPNAAHCKDSSKTIRNSYKDFKTAVNDFFIEGKKFYEAEDNRFRSQRDAKIGGDAGGNTRFGDMMQKRISEFKKKHEEVKKLMPNNDSSAPFTVPFETYNAIFSIMKTLYWDQVVEVYIKKIITQFHNQCDSVLSGARLFEKFVKTLSIADFMNNMEGTI